MCVGRLHCIAFALGIALICFVVTCLTLAPHYAPQLCVSMYTNVALNAKTSSHFNFVYTWSKERFIPQVCLFVWTWRVLICAVGTNWATRWILMTCSLAILSFGLHQQLSNFRLGMQCIVFRLNCTCGTVHLWTALFTHTHLAVTIFNVSLE